MVNILDKSEEKNRIEIIEQNRRAAINRTYCPPVAMKVQLVIIISTSKEPLDIRVPLLSLSPSSCFTQREPNREKEKKKKLIINPIVFIIIPNSIALGCILTVHSAYQKMGDPINVVEGNKQLYCGIIRQLGYKRYNF